MTKGIAARTATVREVEVNGRRYRVGISPTDAGWQVTIDGTAIGLVEARRVDDRWSLLIGSRSYEVAIGETAVFIGGQGIPARAIDPRGWSRGRRAADAAADGPVAIAAPMPGRIIRLLVSPGESVTARRGLVVVEAMKMENELRAPRAGVVREVRVGEGASVDAGAVLLILE